MDGVNLPDNWQCVVVVHYCNCPTLGNNSADEQFADCEWRLFLSAGMHTPSAAFEAVDLRQTSLTSQTSRFFDICVINWSTRLTVVPQTVNWEYFVRIWFHTFLYAWPLYESLLLFFLFWIPETQPLWQCTVQYYSNSWKHQSNATWRCRNLWYGRCVGHFQGHRH